MNFSHWEIQDNWISSQPNPTVHFGKSHRELLLEKEQLSSHYAAYFEADGTCYIHGSHDFTMWTLKIAEVLGRMTSGVTDMRLTSHFSQRR